MTKHKMFCSQCQMYTEHDYSYDRQYSMKGALVVAVCTKCGNRVEEFKRYQE